LGAWGFKPFENDDAADFVAEFEQEGVIAISRALDAGCGTGGYVEAPMVPWRWPLRQSWLLPAV
jgi:hypothetical protein